MMPPGMKVNTIPKGAEVRWGATARSGECVRSPPNHKRGRMGGLKLPRHEIR